MGGPGFADPSSSAIRFGLANRPHNFDPRFATDAASARVNRLLYDRLVKFDDRSLPIPGLARWAQVQPTQYRFTLFPNRRPFHHGEPLTAYDIKATYDSILDPQLASPHRNAVRLIARIEVPDPNTIDFFLRKPDPLFPAYLVHGILPAALIQDHHPFHSAPVGSGPFILEDRPDETHVILTRRSDNQRFDLIHVPDPTVRVLKLLAGEIDMLQNDLPPELVTYLERIQQVVVQRGRGSNVAYLGLNLQDPITGNKAIRQAIAHAIDRQAIITFVLGGAARPANAILPPDHWAGHPNLHGYDFDPDKARTLVAQAGFSKEQPAHLTYKTSSDPFRIRLATILQHQLSAVGLHCDLRSYDWGTFYGDIKAGRFQLFSLAWVGITTPDIFSYLFHSRSIPPAGANRGRFRDPLTDRLIEEAEAAPDLPTKSRIYRRLQERLLEMLPYVPLWFEDHVFIAQRDIQGFTIARDGNYDSLAHVHRRASP